MGRGKVWCECLHALYQPSLNIVLEEDEVLQRKDKYFVYFSACKPIAKAELMGQIPTELVLKFKVQNTKEDIWQTHSSSTGIVLFVDRDATIEEFSKSEAFRLLKKTFYELV